MLRVIGLAVAAGRSCRRTAVAWPAGTAAATAQPMVPGPAASWPRTALARIPSCAGQQPAHGARLPPSRRAYASYAQARRSWPARPPLLSRGWAAGAARFAAQPAQHAAAARGHAPVPADAAAAAADSGADPRTAELSGELPLVIRTKGVPVYLFTRDIEEAARQQLISLAESGAAVGFVAGMPDVHAGKGTAVGSVFASDIYVAPSAVGVDIGCGMVAAPLVMPPRPAGPRGPGGAAGGAAGRAGAAQPLTRSDVPHARLVQIFAAIKERIPVGFNAHAAPLQGTAAALAAITQQHPPSPWLREQLAADGPESQMERAALQLGSLGGGNHFIEVVYSEAPTPAGEQVWAMLHSGSRRIGNVIAEHHEKIAAARTAERLRADPSAPGRSGVNLLEIDSPAGREYLADMCWAQAYAMANRQQMLLQFEAIMREQTGAVADAARTINIHHNFAARELHAVPGSDGRAAGPPRPLWVTRKGATSAQAGQLGLIPGSMGVGSYAVEGKGSPLSWCSCSHGAGRRMSRTAARALIRQEDFEADMKGIVADTVEDVRDEAPGAYKDLTVVMANQSALVAIKHRLLPLVNVKGFDKPRDRKAEKAAFKARRAAEREKELPHY